MFANGEGEGEIGRYTVIAPGTFAVKIVQCPFVITLISAAAAAALLLQFPGAQSPSPGVRGPSFVTADE